MNSIEIGISLVCGAAILYALLYGPHGIITSRRANKIPPTPHRWRGLLRVVQKTYGDGRQTFQVEHLYGEESWIVHTFKIKRKNVCEFVDRDEAEVEADKFFHTLVVAQNTVVI